MTKVCAGCVFVMQRDVANSSMELPQTHYSARPSFSSITNPAERDASPRQKHCIMLQVSLNTEQISRLNELNLLYGSIKNTNQRQYLTHV